MKKIFTSLFLLGAAACSFAQNSNAPTAYYPLPDGAFYIGVNMQGNTAGSEIVLAPADSSLVFKAALDDDFKGDYAWIAEDFGISELDNQDLTISHAAANNLVTAPTLYVVGSGGYNTYQCARGGIAFGYGYLPDGSGNEYYASNYNAEELKGQFYDGTTFVNYPEATTALNNSFAENGKPYTNVTVHGFAESFSYARPYVLKSIHAGVVTDQTLDTTDLAVKVFEIAADGSVGTTPIATFSSDSLYLHETDPNFYEVNFISKNDVVVKSPIMVVVTSSETSDKRFGPEELTTQEQHNGEKGTAYLWADYTFGSTQHTGAYIPYSDQEFHSYGRTYYMKHWNVSIKQDYTIPEQTDGITAVNAGRKSLSNDQAIYSLSGVKIGKVSDFNSLPKGIYIVNGKKVLK